MSLAGFLVAIGGGIFGAAIGALPAFAFVGFLVLIGVAVQLASGNADFFGIPFGAFGPHVGGFASGVAAAGYAARVGKLDTGRNIVVGLMGLSNPAVLLVGAAFGACGYIVQWALSLVPGFGAGIAWTDTPALTVVLSAFIVRLAFGKTGLFGKVPAGEKRYAPPVEKRWLPWQSEPAQLAVIGVGVGLLAGYFGITFGGAGVFLAFGLAASSIILLQFGVQIPVTHHIALPAAIAAAASGSIIWGGIVGLICAFVGEFMARTFLVYGDTHIDPPAATIAPMTTIINLLTAAGFFAAIHLP
ncbi:MAG: permease [Oscillochloris sp.]|nr:permease [Oscillochloris sp.]